MISISKNPLNKSNTETQLLDYSGVKDPNEQNSKVCVDIDNEADTLTTRLHPVTLTWEDITVRVKFRRRCFQKEQEDRIILRNLSGYAKPASFLAIIGSSGSGKTSLINALTGRYDDDDYGVTGLVKVNGLSIGKKVASISVYLQQDDLFIGTSTVREHLNFRASLGLDQRLSRESRRQKVDEVIKELRLTACADTIIGIPGRVAGISGGEKKRLSFASELLSNPSIIFCDEVTSGLDSSMALTVIETLKDLTKLGHTVICCLHQPTSAIFNLFDSIMIMANGRTAFFGSPSDATAFFSEQGYKCPSNFNPSDFYIDTVSIKPYTEGEDFDRVEKICDAFEKSSYTKIMRSDIESITCNDTEKTHFEAVNLSGQKRYRSSWMTQFFEIYKRSSLGIVREPIVLKVRFFITTFYALLLGVFYLQTPYNQMGIQNINGIMIFVLMKLTMSSLFSVLLVFTGEFPTFKREHESRLYRVDTYFLAKTFAEVPMTILVPLVFSIIVYWMTGLYPSFTNCLIFLGIAILIANVATSFAYLVALLSKDLHTVQAIMPAVLVPLIIFSGFFMNRMSFPVYLNWLSYLSWFRYGYELLLINQWSDVTYINCTRPPCIETGKQVLDMLNFSEDNTAFDVGLLFVLLVGYRTCALLILAFRMRKV